MYFLWELGDINFTKMTKQQIGYINFGGTKSFELLVKEVEQFDPSNENYDTIRVIAHILICFGSPYTCPEDFLDQRSIIIKRVLTILENMINPPNSDWEFLDIWGWRSGHRRVAPWGAAPGG